MVRILCHIISFLLFGLAVQAQVSDFVFHNLSEINGLSFNTCNTMLKDGRGILWIGTGNGLNRYDGAHFYQFNAGQKKALFINNNIYDLCEDKTGNIWAGTGSGIFCYSPFTNRFENYDVPGYDYARHVVNIICDKRGDIWATVEWMLLKLNKTKNRFEEATPLTTHKDSVRSFIITRNGLLEDPSGTGLWLTTRNGLHFYHIKEQRFTSYRNLPDDELFARHSTSAITASPWGNFWYFDNTTHEAIAFDPATLKILHRINIGKFIHGAFGQTIFEDSNHWLWISTWNNKLLVLEYLNDKAIVLTNQENNPLSVAGSSFWDVYEDADKNIWLATSGGISKCNYTKNAYTVHTLANRVKEFANDRLGAFSIDPVNNSWWIASEDNPSVINYIPETGQYSYFDFSKAVKNRAGQLPGPVHGIRFVDGQPFACTYTGVWTLNKKTKQVLPFERQFEGVPFIPFTRLVQQGNHIWFTTKKGFIKWNRNLNQAKLLQVSNPVLPDGQTVEYNRLQFDSVGNGWFVPAFGWLASINRKDEISMSYYIKDKPKELSGYIMDFKPDRHQNIWLASNGAGLYRFHTPSRSMQFFGQTTLGNAFIKSVAIDLQDRVWLASLNRFYIFNADGTASGNFVLPLYQNNGTYNNRMAVSADGTVYATLNRDMVQFFPDRLGMKPELKPPFISLINIDGKDSLIQSENRINLEPDQNELEFSFGSLINADNFPYTLEYRLEGFDKSWNTADAGAKAVYNNLNPGDYVFRVKAVSKNKKWETAQRTIMIHIETPFYRATWFWLLISGIFAGILFLSIRFRMNKQKQIHSLETKAQTLEKEKALVQFENLKQHLNPHFLFNSLTSLSGLIETDQNMASGFLSQMSKIYRYILKNRESETVSLQEEMEFVKWYIHLQQTRFGSGLQVKFCINDDLLDRKIAPVTLQNMVENAIKHNIVDQESPLVIEIVTEEDYLVVRNNLQRKRMVETSNRQGLANLQKLYQYLTTRLILIEESEQYYQIKLPLI